MRPSENEQDVIIGNRVLYAEPVARHHIVQSEQQIQSVHKPTALGYQVVYSLFDLDYVAL